MIRRLLSVAGLAAAMALGTWIGWWMVPLIAFLWGVLPAREGAGGRESPGWPALAASLGWAAWLGIDLVAGGSGLGRLASRLGAVVHLSAPVLVLVTLLFPAALAASAARIGAGLVAPLRRRRRPAAPAG